jgi:hypothetical protein
MQGARKENGIKGTLFKERPYGDPRIHPQELRLLDSLRPAIDGNDVMMVSLEASSYFTCSTSSTRCATRLRDRKKWPCHPASTLRRRNIHDTMRRKKRAPKNA